MDYTVWTIQYGVYSMEFTVWSMEYTIWSIQHGEQMRKKYTGNKNKHSCWVSYKL